MKRLFFLLTLLLAASAAMAQITFTPFDNYTQQTTYFTTVQQPINADGTSVWQARKAGAVVPVKFKLGTGLGDVTIASTSTYPSPASDGGVYADISGLQLTLDQLGTLQFEGTITGNCGGGSPRFQIGYGSQNIFVYLGDAPNWSGVNCGTTYGATHNFMTDTDLRFDTSQVGGSFYDTLSHARTLMSGVPIQNIVFVVDAFWSAGNQKVEINSVTVNNNKFTFGGGTPTPTCTLPTATIDVFSSTADGLVSVDESTYNFPADTSNYFRVADCQYLYNLSTKALGAGNYKVFVNIGGTDISTTPGQFALK